jgi:lipoate-protein ligase A
MDSSPGPACRLLPYEIADGPFNMAADETLLGSAAAGVASLRFYGWSEPTVSLGYFQSERVRPREEHLSSLPYVRRPSGGAALVHHHELTYALALPAGKSWQPGQSWMCRMHSLIADALCHLGVETAACAEPGPAGSQPTMLCFRQLTPGDLRIGGAKVAGSAQRRQRGVLLQHGAVLLETSPFAPSLPGIRELSGRTLTAALVGDSVGRAFSRNTGWELVPGEWTPSERDLIAELAAVKYTQVRWNRKR